MLYIRGVNPDLHPVMRMAEVQADAMFQKHGQRDAIMTSGRDRDHSTGSFHGYGLAFDLRTNDLPRDVINKIVEELVILLPSFDILLEPTHLHIEVGRKLGAKLGAYSI